MPARGRQRLRAEKKLKPKDHCFTGLILIIGLLGNGIVLAVISNLRRRGHKTSVQLFLVNLAVSDLMVCLLCIPLTIFINFYYPNKIAERDVGFCKLARVTQVKILMYNVLTVTISEDLVEVIVVTPLIKQNN